jgi:protease-4
MNEQQPNSSSNQTSNFGWEQQAIREVLLENVYEKRRSRRWGIFFKLVALGLIIFILFDSYHGKHKATLVGKPHVARIEIKGVISADSVSNAPDIIAALKDAADSKDVKAIVLDINSPGGSPVQARMVYHEIQRIKAQPNKPKIYAVIGDIGTSAAYLVASAAHEVYADETSFVGSIGALVNGFGFVGAMEKLGIERRLYTSGKFKGMLDPFSPANPEEVQFLQKNLDEVHDIFIENVKAGRGERLKDSDQNNLELFSGKFWLGKDALALGLIDGFADINKLAVEIIKVEDIVDYAKPENLLERISKKLPAGIQDMALRFLNSQN